MGAGSLLTGCQYPAQIGRTVSRQHGRTDAGAGSARPAREGARAPDPDDLAGSGSGHGRGSGRPRGAGRTGSPFRPRHAGLGPGLPRRRFLPAKGSGITSPNRGSSFFQEKIAAAPFFLYNRKESPCSVAKKFAESPGSPQNCLRMAAPFPRHPLPLICQKMRRVQAKSEFRARKKCRSIALGFSG